DSASPRVPGCGPVQAIDCGPVPGAGCVPGREPGRAAGPRVSLSQGARSSPVSHGGWLPGTGVPEMGLTGVEARCPGSRTGSSGCAAPARDPLPSANFAVSTGLSVHARDGPVLLPEPHSPAMSHGALGESLVLVFSARPTKLPRAQAT